MKKNSCGAVGETLTNWSWVRLKCFKHSHKCKLALYILLIFSKNKKLTLYPPSKNRKFYLKVLQNNILNAVKMYSKLSFTPSESLHTDHEKLKIF